jgi:hypothetical protein
MGKTARTSNFSKSKPVWLDIRGRQAPAPAGFGRLAWTLAPPAPLRALKIKPFPQKEDFVLRGDTRAGQEPKKETEQ